VRSTQLYVPEGQPVKFEVSARDVLHDFWVPAWRMKIDAVPGVSTSIRVTPNKRGTYPVVCAELCGLGHAFMRQNARVVSREDFDAWLRKQRAGGTAGGAESGQAVVSGKTLFAEGNGQAASCGSCHKLADAGTTGTTGPALDAYVKGADAAQIKRDIVDPNAEVAKGFGPNIMPPNYEQLLSGEELDALVKYLDEVSK
jgi:cytochrome c oxidase subunit 2